MQTWGFALRDVPVQIAFVSHIVCTGSLFIELVLFDAAISLSDALWRSRPSVIFKSAHLCCLNAPSHTCAPAVIQAIYMRFLSKLCFKMFAANSFRFVGAWSWRKWEVWKWKLALVKPNTLKKAVRIIPSNHSVLSKTTNFYFKVEPHTLFRPQVTCEISEQFSILFKTVLLY